jgi:tetratricopeptide (TPR) repeat protein
MAALVVLGETQVAQAQRGRGGGGRMGGGMSHPGGMARPSMPMNRPAMGGMNRPTGGGNFSRPNMGNFNRPGGGMNRPASLPGQGGGNRPGMGGNFGGGNRPEGGGNRPGMGGNFAGGGRGTQLPAGSGNRPNFANRPGAGGGGEQLRPGGGNRPNFANRPGAGGGGEQLRPGGGNRPGWANRPGAGGGGEQWRPGGDNRPGWANRPGAGGGGTQWPGGGNRPGWANRPGAGGGGEQWRPGNNRPGGGGNWAGGGNRPGWDNRPGGGNGIGNRNNWGIGSGNIGSGNIGHIGDNLGVVGGNTNISNISNSGGNTFYGGNSYSGGGNYFGGGNYAGGGYGGYGGGYGGAYGGYGGGYGSGGWASPYYGNWYQGAGSNLGSFWGGYGLGAASSFGLGTALAASSYPSSLGSYGSGDYGYPVYGGYGYGTGSGVYDYFPTWGVSSVGDWGLAPMASTWLSSNYANPYSSTNSTNTTVVYDYSQPINVTDAPPEPTAADSSEQVFSAARDAFKAGNYQRALDLTDQVIKSTPNAPVVHEFRALCLFALKRYDDAASVAYAVLSAGPCWNWSTLVGLYPDVDTYTNQLRGLEDAVRSNLNATPPRFLLAYQYLVQGSNDAAEMEFAEVAKHEPKDQLSASFAKALAKAKEPAATPSTGTGPAVAGAQPTTTDGKPLVPTSLTVPNAPASGTAPASAAPPAGTAGSTAPAEEPPPPPAEMMGTWKASPSADITITLKLETDGAFQWDVAHKGQPDGSISGRAYYLDNVLSLTQENGPPLAGKIESKEPNKFSMRLMGGRNNAPALTFTH